jgi:hypothetical protein
MKENIFTNIVIGQPVPSSPWRKSCISLLLISFALASTAQFTSPFNTRNSDRSASVNSVSAVKTLSTIPTVTPHGNVNAVPDRDSRQQNPLTSANAGLRDEVVRSSLVRNRNSTTLNAGNLLLSPTAAKLASFSGVSGNGEYRLQWEPVIEDNVKQYDLEYSTNNRDFQSAAVVMAANKNVYSFTHVTALRPSMYYRLKVTDHNGASAYTNALAVTSSLAQPEDLVAPTIIRDGVLNVTLKNSYKDLQVLNSAGVEVFREYLGGRTGNRIGFTLPALPAGAYFVRFIGTGVSATQRVLVM